MYHLLEPDLDAGAHESSGLSEKSLINTTGRPLQKRSHDAEAKQTTNEDACSGERSPISPNSSAQGISDHTQNGSTNSSLFDVVSSDEDMGKTVEAPPTGKRRKLRPIRRGTTKVQGVARKANAVPTSHDNLARNTPIAQSIETTYLSSGSERSRADSNPPPRSAVTWKPRNTSRASSKGAAARITIDLIDSEEEVRVVSMTSSPTPPQTPLKRSPRTQRSHSSSPSAQLIDQLNRSIPFESRMTKRFNQMADKTHDKSGVPSPSQLAMRSLRLTPEEAVQPEADPEGHKVSVVARPLTPSRSRRRLIDALDSPRKQSIVRHTHVESPSSSADSSVNDEMDTSGSAEHPVSQTNKIQVGKIDEPPSKPVPVLPVAGPKVTYAKQRSHLSDMVLEDTSDFAVPSIAHLVEPAPAAKASANKGFGSQRSQEDSKNEEDATGGAIRSIHELRQAGENSRFQGNLDSIFEDLEAAGRTGRSRRLRALMLLTQKFLEPSFCLRFVENGMHQRLANHALKEEDVLSSVLTSCALSILLSSCKPSLKVLQQVFDAVIHSSAPLLKETRELSKLVKAMAKDRKQNLSGATCKDVIDFQQTILASQMWTTSKPTGITPQLVALRSIEIAVRGLRELKDFETPLPLLVFGHLVVILEGMTLKENIDLAAPEPSLTLESTISILEFSTLFHGLVEDGYNEVAKRLCILGPLLAKAKVLPKESHDKFEQLVLRLIISVSNNNSVLCESLGQSALIPAISTIVRKNFLELAEYADSGKALDEPKLESVILALGSLINFAECSQSSRLAMNQAYDAGEIFVEWLVVAFNRRAGKASEVRIPLVDVQRIADTSAGIISRTNSCPCYIWVPLHAHLYIMSRPRYTQPRAGEYEK
jgi:hypothetical protein